MTIPTNADVPKVLHAAESERRPKSRPGFTAYVAVCAFAGIGAGKNLIDAAGGITVVARPPKYESERTIYLADEVVAILAEHVRQHTPNGEPDCWRFDEDGKRWHDNRVDYRWRSTRTKAGVTYKLHELRHYFASGLMPPDATLADSVRTERGDNALTCGNSPFQ